MTERVRRRREDAPLVEQPVAEVQRCLVIPNGREIDLRRTYRRYGIDHYEYDPPASPVNKMQW
jgi:hypothetical protein